MTEQDILKKPFVFVDLETTGQYPETSRILEIGILKVIDGVVTETFNQIVNPEIPISPFTNNFTGISQKDADAAPTFKEVSESVLTLIDDSLFIAQNVGFDYGFLETEFANIGTSFALPLADTIRVTKKFYPNLINYKLDTLIKIAGIRIADRHRALGDAKALWELIQYYEQSFGKNRVNEVLASVMKIPKGFGKEEAAKGQMTLL